MYVPVAGFVSRLNDHLAIDDRHLPIPLEAYEWLLEHLQDGDHTFMLLRDGNAVEYVKVTNVCDKLVLDRGAELTRPFAFRCGSGIAFVMTAQGVKDAVCQMEDCDTQ